MKKILMSILAIITLISTIGGTVRAATTEEIIDTSRKASLTITKYEHANGSKNNKPLAGVEFTVYSVPSTIETAASAESYVKSNTVTKQAKTTGTDGTVKFTNLALGRYLVVETKAPKNVMTKIESFLIDLPRTKDNGSGWNYDVTVYPKNVTIYGKVTLTHYSKTGEHLQGTTWKLEKKDKSGNYVQYEEIGTLTTNKDGKIVVENLEKGEYRLVPVSTLNGYILNQTDTKNFTIDKDNINYNLTATSEKLNIQKYVKLTDGGYGEQVGAFSTDVASWKTVADIATIISKMGKYTITEELTQGLKFQADSLHIYGEKSGKQTELSSSDFTSNVQGQKVTIDFNNKNALKNYDKVVVMYDTKFDYNTVKNGKYESKAILEYTNNINISGESKSTFKTNEAKANVYTASVLIFKSDVEGNGLQGAQFKIATSKENAKNNTFVKDSSNNDVIATSDKNGYVVFNGLKIGQDNQKYESAQSSYWIVEVQAPSYEENGETKYYNLLDKPVEVQVTSTSGAYSVESTTPVINKKGFTLPLTGGTLNIIPIVTGASLISAAIILRKKNRRDEKAKAE